MARKIIIAEILNLIKGIGGNPNRFMGTKSNINFLGKGPKESPVPRSDRHEIIRPASKRDGHLRGGNGWRLRGCKQT